MPLAVIDVLKSNFVRYKEMRRRYKSATQCSALDLPVTEMGWQTVRNCAIEGLVGRSLTRLLYSAYAIRPIDPKPEIQKEG